MDRCLHTSQLWLQHVLYPRGHRCIVFLCGVLWALTQPARCSLLRVPGSHFNPHSLSSWLLQLHHALLQEAKFGDSARPDQPVSQSSQPCACPAANHRFNHFHSYDAEMIKKTGMVHTRMRPRSSASFLSLSLGHGVHILVLCTLADDPVVTPV